MAYVSQDDKKKLAPAIKAVLAKYKMKGTIGVANHSTLVVNLSSGEIDFGTNQMDVNVYWIESTFGKDTVATKFLTELKAAMEGPDFFNEDDVMTDYFHRSHYIDINIGTWKKPYTVVEAN